MQVGNALAVGIRVAGVEKERKGESEFVVVEHDSPVTSFLFGEIDTPLRFHGSHPVQPEKDELPIRRGRGMFVSGVELFFVLLQFCREATIVRGTHQVLF